MNLYNPLRGTSVNSSLLSCEQNETGCSHPRWPASVNTMNGVVYAERSEYARDRNDNKGVYGGILKKILPYFLCLMVCLGCVSPAFAEFTIEDEKKLGQEFYEKMVKHDFLVQDKQVNDYITKVGETCLKAISNSFFEYRFSVVRSSAVNAFATPGGYIYVNHGLITLVENEGELAAVIAHEIAHVHTRHIADMVSKQTKLSIAALAAAIAGAFLGGGGEVTAAAMSFSIAAMQTLSLKYSRDNEEEADRYGLVYLTEAGYRAEGALNLLKLMRRYEFYSNSVPSYFMTHPGTDDRIRYIDGLLHTVYANNRGQTEIVGPFRRIKMMLMTRGELESRVRYFEEEVKNNPSDVDSLYGLGLVQSRKGRYNESLETLRRALSFAPKDPDILRELGAACFKMGRYAEGLPYLSQALEISKDDVGTLSWLGNTYEALAIYDKALKCYQALETLDPTDHEIYYSIGMIYGKMKDIIPHRYYMGLYFQKQGKMDTALFHFREGLKHCVGNDLFCEDIRKAMAPLSQGKKKR